MNGAGRDATIGRTDAETPTVIVSAPGRDRGYPVFVRRGAIAEIPSIVRNLGAFHRIAVISDSTVSELYGAELVDRLRDSGFGAHLFSFPAGEAHKTRASWAALTDAMLDAEFGRDALVVAIGGGVTGDLGGFVASTYMRGIPLIQVPTSTVAMIDAAVGGKTGVDTDGGKNLVGAFHPPLAVVADPDTIATLPRAQRAEGFAEAVKHGVIRDVRYFDDLASHAADLLEGAADAVDMTVRRSVELKGDVVSSDERESGVREILNFGHTLGHALEASSDFALPHGEAVSFGMVLESRLGEAIGVTEAGTGRRLAEVLTSFGLPTTAEHLPIVRDPHRIVDLCRSDKKARASTTRYVLLDRIGVVAQDDGTWSRPVPDEAVLDVLADSLG